LLDERGHGIYRFGAFKARLGCLILLRVLLTSALRAMVKDVKNRNFLLKTPTFLLS